MFLLEQDFIKSEIPVMMMARFMYVVIWRQMVVGGL